MGLGRSMFYFSNYALPRQTQQLKIVSSSFNSIQGLKISYPCLQRNLIIFKTYSRLIVGCATLISAQGV